MVCFKKVLDDTNGLISEDVLQNGENHTMPPSIRKAKSIVGAIAVSSAEAKRDFSKMNVIYSDKRSRLLVENVSNLMTIDLLGLPQKEWDPTSSVKLWLCQNHSADDSCVKQKRVVVVVCHDQVRLQVSQGFRCRDS